MNKNISIGLIILGTLVLVTGFVLSAPTWENKQSFIHNIGNGYITIRPHVTEDGGRYYDRNHRVLDVTKGWDRLLLKEMPELASPIKQYGTFIDLSTVIICSLIMIAVGTYGALTTKAIQN